MAATTLGSKIVGIAAMGGIKICNTTAITISVRADMRITKAGTIPTKIYSVLPAHAIQPASGITVSPSRPAQLPLDRERSGARDSIKSA